MVDSSANEGKAMHQHSLASTVTSVHRNPRNSKMTHIIATNLNTETSRYSVSDGRFLLRTSGISIPPPAHLRRLFVVVCLDAKLVDQSWTYNPPHTHTNTHTHTQTHTHTHTSPPSFPTSPPPPSSPPPFRPSV